FCLFNSVAIAARHAVINRNLERVAIIDYDVHHGNGTQNAFENDPSVLFISTHQYPHYPGTGWIGEKGRGNIVNVPVPVQAGDDGFDQILNHIVRPMAHRYDPNLILVSAGFDAHWTDPLASLAISLTGYAKIARQLVDLSKETCDGRIVFTLEGGYDLNVLSQAAQNVFYALLGDTEISDTIGLCPYPERSIDDRILEVRKVHGIDD
ncbi:MAG: histone deacetylase, partial [Anaerolineales bacterium]|nr:histone deacetylase [Anaerolineales bacterium]